MRVLVIGKGGREHALVRALKMSPSVSEVHALPGSDGIKRDATCHSVSLQDSKALKKFTLQNEFSLIVIGPEVELAQGLADFFRSLDIPTFGPNQVAAELEASKVFAKKFMLDNKVPTSRTHFVSSVEQALLGAKDFQPPYVLKADGLAAGKGVIICQTLDELAAAAKMMFDDKKFGEAGVMALLEEFQPGWELSYLVLTDGKTYQTLPLAQDHKRLRDGDLGPNTGGMGVVAPLNIEESLQKRINREIVEPSLEGIRKNGEMDYRGVLYIGLMITTSGPRVIEYNVRFGDPETQVILPLLDGDWGGVLKDVANGNLQPLKWKPLHAACVVMAAAGYPDSPKTGVSMVGDVFYETSSSYFLHAGTYYDVHNHWLVSGGRVLNAIGLGSSLEEALQNSYAQAEKVSWPGQQLRKDIGQKVLGKNILGENS